MPPLAVNAIIAGIVGFNFFTALSPLSSTFSESNQADVKKRPKGPTQNPKINPVENPQEFLGIDKVGLSLIVMNICYAFNILYPLMTVWTLTAIGGQEENKYEVMTVISCIRRLQTPNDAF